MQLGATTRATWRPVYTASTWSTLLAGMRDTLAARRGAMTNAEAVAFIREWRDVAPGGAELWWQFAALAYGWSPTRDKFATSMKQAQATYSPTMQPELWQWAADIASELDARSDGQPPRIAVNKETFADLAFMSNVRARLKEDGAKATLAAKIPTGACRDKKTGKVRYPRLTDKPGDCVPETIDDPITVVKKKTASMFQLALLVGAVWLLWDSKPRRVRRTRRA